MAVSNSFDYSRTAAQVINAALRKVTVLAEGASPTTNQSTTALEALNLMVKAWITKQVPVHQIRIAYIYPEDGINELELGNASGDHEWSLELGLTKLTAAEAASQTALSVSTTAADDVVGTTANSDIVGIALDDGTIQWTTISSGGGTTEITVATGLASAAASGNRVYFFTARAFRPEDVLEVWHVDAATGDRRELELAPEQVVRGLDQTEEGKPIKFYWRLMLDDSIMGIWPRWDNGTSYLEARIVYPFDDLDATSDTLSFPPHMYQALVYGLAVRLAPEYGLALQERMLLKQEADAIIEEAFSHLREGTSVFVQPRTS